MSKNKKQNKLTFISVYIGFVVASLLGILIGTIMWIGKERTNTLIHINANQSALYTYIKNAYQPDNTGSLEGILNQFPTLYYASIHHDQDNTLQFQAAQDRNSSWLSLPRDYHPSFWEISYYTQKIDRFTLATPEDGILRVTLVFNLLGKQSIIKMTTLALSGVLILLLITIMVAFLVRKSKKRDDSSPTSREKESSQKKEDPINNHPNVPSPTMPAPYTYHEDDDLIETELSSSKEETTNESLDFFQNAENPLQEEDNSLDPFSSTESEPLTSEPTLDIPEELHFQEEEPNFSDAEANTSLNDLDIADLEIPDFHQEELPRIDDLPEDDADLVAPTDLDFLTADDESALPNDEEVFLEPLESIEYDYDEPQEISFNSEGENEFLDEMEEISSEIPEIEDNDIDEISPDMENLPELELFDEEPETPSAFDQEFTEMEPFNESIDTLEDIRDDDFTLDPIPNIQETLDEITNDFNLLDEKITENASLPEEDFQSEVLKNLEDQLAQSKPLALIFLQENVPSDYFSTALDTFFEELLKNQSLQILHDTRQRYALILTEKSSEESFALLEELSKNFQVDDLTFVAGISTNEERDGLSSPVLWKEAQQALERAINSGDENALIAFKVDKSKYSSLSLEP